MAITKEILSGSISGRPITVAATSSPGTAIHTAIAGSAQHDQIFLWSFCNHTANVVLTVEFGGTSAGDQIIQTVTFKDGWSLICPGLPLNGGCIVKAFAATTNVVLISGYVLRGP